MDLLVKKIHDRESCQDRRAQNTNFNRQASDVQERTRVQNMDPETFAAHQ